MTLLADQTPVVLPDPHIARIMDQGPEQYVLVGMTGVTTLISCPYHLGLIERFLQDHRRGSIPGVTLAEQAIINQYLEAVKPKELQ